jgi:hypothetical protein
MRRTEGSEMSWRRSKRCDTSACVEVAADDRVGLLRDSKDPGSVLTFGIESLRAFIAAAKDGRYDR